MSYTSGNGRLCNQIIRNIATSLIAEKFDLYVEYNNHEIMKKIGLNLFVGSKKYKNTIRLSDNNYFKILESNKLESNINPNNNYFQTKKITHFIHDHIKNIQKKIIDMNPNKNLYNRNNDCFIHIRLGSVEKFNPGFKYYDDIISSVNPCKIYLATDSIEHKINKKLKDKYKQKLIFMDDDLLGIFQLGSTCKYVILSYGSFSAFIGYISFFSKVYYKKIDEKTAWDYNQKTEHNMFDNHRSNIEAWKRIS